MTHNQCALTTLISEVLADPDLAHSDVFRRILQAGLQDLINAEATVKIGAAPHERSPERTTRRNGTRSKTLATRAGEDSRRYGLLARVLEDLRVGGVRVDALHAAVRLISHEGVAITRASAGSIPALSRIGPSVSVIGGPFKAVQQVSTPTSQGMLLRLTQRPAHMAPPGVRTALVGPLEYESIMTTLATQAA